MQHNALYNRMTNDGSCAISTAGNWTTQL